MINPKNTTELLIDSFLYFNSSNVIKNELAAITIDEIIVLQVILSLMYVRYKKDNVDIKNIKKIIPVFTFVLKNRTIPIYINICAKTSDMLDKIISMKLLIFPSKYIPIT